MPKPTAKPKSTKENELRAIGFALLAVGLGLMTIGQTNDSRPAQVVAIVVLLASSAMLGASIGAGQKKSK